MCALLSTFWCVCVTMEVIVWVHEKLFCIHILNVRELYIFICQSSACRLSHQDNYPEPQVDSYVCQSAAYFPSFLLKE